MESGVATGLDRPQPFGRGVDHVQDGFGEGDPVLVAVEEEAQGAGIAGREHLVKERGTIGEERLERGRSQRSLTEQGQRLLPGQTPVGEPTGPTGTSQLWGDGGGRGLGLICRPDARQLVASHRVPFRR